MTLPCSVPARSLTMPRAALLVGRAGGLRDEASGLARPAIPVIARLDRPQDLSNLAGEKMESRTLRGIEVILITEPLMPGFSRRLRHRQRLRVLTAAYTSLARAARDLGADQLVVCSTAFLYADDQGRPLDTSAPVVPRVETAEAFAAEQAAELFSVLGGRSVVLRFGWVFGDRDPVTARVVSAAQKGWQLIDGQPSSWVPAIARADAASAIHAATAAPGHLQHQRRPAGHPRRDTRRPRRSNGNRSAPALRRLLGRVRDSLRLVAPPRRYPLRPTHRVAAIRHRPSSLPVPACPAKELIQRLVFG